ncbi:MAG TPA: hypothetical protein VLL95_15515 [Phnomibacter sp.]|nr:hypothetical protein [Phnomibacter sp.]
MKESKPMTEQESLAMISEMIAKAKTSYHDTGAGSILWGTIISFCSLVTWAQIHFQWSIPFDIWLLTLLAVVATIYWSARDSKRRKVKSYDQTAMDYTWTCFGIAIFLVVHANAGTRNAFNDLKDSIEAAGLSRPSISFSDYAPAYLLVLYGIPTLVTAGIKNFRPMLIGGIVCWVSAVLVVYVDSETDMLLMALSAIAAWLIPGLVLRRRCAKRKEAADV